MSRPVRQRPVRTCVGCGQKAEQPALVRLVVSPAPAGAAQACADGTPGALGAPGTMAGPQVVFGQSGRGGRGAWLHPAPACLDRAVKRRAFGRALRLEGVRIDAGSLRVGLTGNARKD